MEVRWRPAGRKVEEEEEDLTAHNPKKLPEKNFEVILNLDPQTRSEPQTGAVLQVQLVHPEPGGWMALTHSVPDLVAPETIFNLRHWRTFQQHLFSVPVSKSSGSLCCLRL